MENEQNTPRKKRITLQDCLEDWSHVPFYEGDKIVYESFTEEEKEDMRKRSFLYSACDRITQDNCYDYFVFDYNLDKIDQFFKERKWTPQDVQFEGLIKMFNDGWIKSPAYVDWKEGLYFTIDPTHIEILLLNISDPIMRVQILQFIIDNADYLLDKQDMEKLPFYEYLLSVHRIDAQFSMQDKEYNELLKHSKPQSGDNNAIRKYMEAKIRTDSDFKIFCSTHSLKDIVHQKLEPELHIDINVNSLQRNIRRSQRKMQKGTIGQ